MQPTLAQTLVKAAPVCRLYRNDFLARYRSHQEHSTS
jgi:hypothetical protein